MSAEKNKANASTEKVSLNIDLGNIFKKLPINEDDAEDLLPLLEPGEKVESKNIDYHDFCKAYTIELIKKYGSTADEKELLLAAFGLLKGFEFDSQEYGKRMIEYRKTSRDYNKCLKRIKTEDEDNVLRTIRNKVDKIITKLIKRLVGEMENDKLGLISTVPNRLQLPELREVYNDNQNDDNKATDGGDRQNDADKSAGDRKEKGKPVPKVKYIVKYIKEKPTFGEYFKKFWWTYACTALFTWCVKNTSSPLIAINSGNTQFISTQDACYYDNISNQGYINQDKDTGSLVNGELSKPSVNDSNWYDRILKWLSGEE